MRIVAVEVQSTLIPVVRSHAMAIGTTRHQENVIVKVYTDDGTFGWGEAPHMVGHSQLGETPSTVRAILRDKLIPAVLGQSCLRHEALAVAMDRAVPGNGRAKGALMMAAYDLAGKLLGTPVYNLLGGKFRDAIPLSWSLPIIDISLAVDEGIKMVERGWKVLKIKLGREKAQDDAEMVLALRNSLGSAVHIRADANQAYDLKTAMRMVTSLEEGQVEFFEQPLHMNDLDGLSELVRQSPVPIMVDESATSVERLAEIACKKAADFVSIYIIGPGGIQNSKKMAVLAGAHRMRGYIGGALESVIGAAAGLHLAASSPSVDLGCELNGQFLLREDISVEPLTFNDGCLVVPDDPGLGIAVDEQKITKYRQGDVELFRVD